jgi:hypothetical protein
MLRLSVFAILGPLIGNLVFIGLGGGIKGDNANAVFGILLPLAWIAGLFPAAITAGLDRVFERLGTTLVQRCLLTGIAGYAIVYSFMLENYFEVVPLFPFRYDWGLTGAVPAVFCSLVTDKLEVKGLGERPASGTKRS